DREIWKEKRGVDFIWNSGTQENDQGLLPEFLSSRLKNWASSLNYRHRFHAGNFADVVKHVVLVQLVRAMQRKEKGFLFLDSHAGRGQYDLGAADRGDSLPRRPEWPDGIGRLWTREDLPEPVADYRALVRECDGRRRGGNQAGES